MTQRALLTGAFGRRHAAWHAATPIPGVDPGFARLDAFGTEIHWHQYGRLGAVYGWQIDTSGDSSGAGRLRAMHWCNAAGRHRPPQGAALRA
ncbi:hypothetical protein ACFOGJ_09765 [Marinibaculum pumilum]|uniref:Uncharacterized protein n=1 Tax=Marinibaculum pumilum TaxID=1766165 RepID=A0ABV7KYX8_9PROT